MGLGSSFTRLNGLSWGLLWLATTLGINLVLGLIYVLLHMDLSDPTHAVPTLSSAELALFGLIQFGSMVFLAWGFTKFVSYNLHSSFFGDSRPTSLSYLVAVALGFTIGIVPSAVVIYVKNLFPSLNAGNLEAIAQALTSDLVEYRILFLIHVVILAPFVEELAFRGFLWHSFEKSLPPWATWLATSACFAAFHLDPVHATGVIWTGLFLGWLRWKTGSIWPGVIAHFVNNGLATIAVIAFPNYELETQLSGWLFLVGIAVPLALATLLIPSVQNSALSLPEDAPPIDVGG